MDDSRHYRVIPHACRACGGRLLRAEREDKEALVRYRCANCGIHQDAPAENRYGHRLLCFCGAKPPGGVKLALRCVANPQQRLEAPDQIIVTAVGLTDQPEPVSR